MLHTKLRTAEAGDFFSNAERYSFMTAKLPPRPKQPHRSGSHTAPVRRTNGTPHPVSTTGKQTATLAL